MAHVNTTANNRSDAVTYDSMQRPQSSMFRFVFPWDDKEKIFNTNDFNPVEKTEGRLRLQDFERLLCKLQLCTNYENKGPWWCINIIMPICVVLSFLILFLGLFIGEGDYIVFIWVFYFLALLSSIVIPIFYFQKKKKISLIERESEFKAIIDRENATNLQGRDIRWGFIQMSSCLTLELDYMVRQMNQNNLVSDQPQQVPVIGNFSPFSQENQTAANPQVLLNDGYVMAKSDGRFD